MFVEAVQDTDGIASYNKNDLWTIIIISNFQPKHFESINLTRHEEEEQDS